MSYQLDPSNQVSLIVCETCYQTTGTELPAMLGLASEQRIAAYHARMVHKCRQLGISANLVGTEEDYGFMHYRCELCDGRTPDIEGNFHYSTAGNRYEVIGYRIINPSKQG